MAIRILLLFTMILLTKTIFARDKFPFQLVGRLIIIQANVNEKPGNYILDTGSFNLVLNDRYFQTADAELKGRVTGIKGHSVEVYKDIVKLQIGEIEWKNTEAELLSLNHLEKTKDLPIMGLIGTYIFRHYQLIFDFENLEITLLKVVGKNKEAPYFSDQAADVLLPLGFKGGMPILEVIVGDQQLQFGLDTGSEANILDVRMIKKIGDHLTFRKNKNLNGIHREKQEIQAGLLHEIIVDQFLIPNLNIVIIPLTDFNWKSPGKFVNGLIGTDFIMHFKTAINFKEGRLEMWYRNGSQALIVKR